MLAEKRAFNYLLPPNLHAALWQQFVAVAPTTPAATATAATPVPRAVVEATVKPTVDFPHLKVVISDTIVQIDVVTAELGGLVRERQS